MQEAKLAKEKMHGRLACGRPLVVRVSSEKYTVEAAENSSKGAGEATKTSLSGSSSGQTSRSSKIAAIKNKLKALEEEGFSAKKQKQTDTSLQWYCWSSIWQKLTNYGAKSCSISSCN